VTAPSTDLATALAAGPVVLDGGLATELERRGHDLSSALWSARVLRDEPGEVVAAHRAFVDAGARVLTTASYQASFDGLAAAGVDADGTRALLRRSVELAREAAGDEPVWVAASVGPYGAARADGSEYTGAYGALHDLAALRRWHRERLLVLADAGADVLALETVPCLAEAQALVEEAEAAGVRAWLSLTTVTGPDGRVVTRRGEPAREAFALARDSDAVIAVGVNCTDPTGVPAAAQLAARVSGKPVVVYPNSGESWDAQARAWTGPARFDPADVEGWLRAGARLVGGCCRVTPSAVAAVAAVAVATTVATQERP
jgi:homocysteine S-methyltransferase